MSGSVSVVCVVVLVGFPNCIVYLYTTKEELGEPDYVCCGGGRIPRPAVSASAEDHPDNLSSTYLSLSCPLHYHLHFSLFNFGFSRLLLHQCLLLLIFSTSTGFSL